MNHIGKDTLIPIGIVCSIGLALVSGTAWFSATLHRIDQRLQRMEERMASAWLITEQSYYSWELSRTAGIQTPDAWDIRRKAGGK